MVPLKLTNNEIINEFHLVLNSLGVWNDPMEQTNILHRLGPVKPAENRNNYLTRQSTDMIQLIKPSV